MGERPVYPTDRDIADARERELELRTHVAYPGRVQAYYPETQTADIVPLIRHPVPQPDGSYTEEELPVLPCTPVLFPRLGPWFLSFPVAPGDTGLILCLTAAIGTWWAGNGDVASPGDLRRQHLAHAVFLPVALVPRAQALTRTGDAGLSAPPNPVPTGLVLGSDGDGPRLLLRANGSLDIITGADGSNGVSLRADADQTVHIGGATGQFVALENLVMQNFNTLLSAISGAATVPNDGGAAFKAAILAALSGWPISVAATKTKAT